MQQFAITPEQKTVYHCNRFEYDKLNDALDFAKTDTQQERQARRPAQPRSMNTGLGLSPFNTCAPVNRLLRSPGGNDYQLKARAVSKMRRSPQYYSIRDLDGVVRSLSGVVLAEDGFIQIPENAHGKRDGGGWDRDLESSRGKRYLHHHRRAR